MEKHKKLIEVYNKLNTEQRVRWADASGYNSDSSLYEDLQMGKCRTSKIFRALNTVIDNVSLCNILMGIDCKEQSKDSSPEIKLGNMDEDLELIIEDIKRLDSLSDINRIKKVLTKAYSSQRSRLELLAYCGENYI